MDGKEVEANTAARDSEEQLPEEAARTHVEVSRVSYKAPEFIDDEPEVWFTLL